MGCVWASTPISRTAGAEDSSNRLKSSDNMQNARKTKQTDWAMTSVQCRIPVKPNIAAMSAMTTQLAARFNMEEPPPARRRAQLGEFLPKAAEQTPRNQSCQLYNRV